ncbi:YbhB/YbcL family Raf kinase inhibitor-like protein [Streptosporangium sp. G11]|jgi:Raf kinase inhibitor-like YbhB/YbcL family protein|uniref:YbhB/YbcL family Raf kinase inhibitor-like protein n=1 Tax=Streptosporangium sp. G11 TaxID=3436926 RepID=UPI003EBF3268
MGQPKTSTRRPRHTAKAAVAAALAVMSSGCGMANGMASTERLQLEPISVSSPRVRDGGPLPSDYSCKGSAGNPPLRWSRVPEGTKSVAIVVDNNSRTGGEVNWVVFDIDPRTNELPEGSVPVGAVEGSTTSGKVGYSPPCGAQENYRFTVYALGGKVDLRKGALLDKTLKSIADKTIAWGRLTAAHIE